MVLVGDPRLDAFKELQTAVSSRYIPPLGYPRPYPGLRAIAGASSRPPTAAVGSFRRFTGSILCTLCTRIVPAVPLGGILCS